MNIIKRKTSTQIKKQSAFTLAEVLITLGVIGIVAALTIPTLIKNSEDAEFKAAWKKNASVITNAYNMVKVENGTLNSFFPGPNNAPAALKLEMIKKLSVINDCSDNGTIICGTTKNMDMNTYKTLGSRTLTPVEFNSGSVVLKDGSVIMFRNYHPTYLSIFVDVNGTLKGPNVLGRDLFGLTATKDWIKPFGSIGSVTCNCNKNPSSHGGQEAGWADEATLYCEGAACSLKYIID